MEDSQIIELYWLRDESAIPATSEKYGGYCRRIALNILESREDAEECLNDTYLGAWNSMPPHRPDILRAFLGKITRDLSVSRYRRNRAAKRGGGAADAVIGELGDCVSGRESVAEEAERSQLISEINSFLANISERKRDIFILRYWYADSVGSIAKRFGMSENSVSVTLNRLRKSLRDYLIERGNEL